MRSSRAVRTLAWNAVRGCGCRSRAVRRADVRAVRRGVSGADFTQTKPSWPSSTYEPPVRRRPAPAGRLLEVGCRHHTPGRPSWPPCVGGARSGLERCGHLHRASRRAVPARRAAGRNTAGGVPGSKNRSGLQRKCREFPDPMSHCVEIEPVRNESGRMSD